MFEHLCKEIKKAGFRVFVAERGNYGIYTDTEGTRVVSFNRNSFNGNYRPTAKSGTGWRLQYASYENMLYQCAPIWANKNPKYTTLKQYLKMYNKTSKYKEMI